MFSPPPIDAVAPNPKTGDHVWLRGRRYDRAPLETAWLTLAETGGDRIAALRSVLGLMRDDYAFVGSEYVTAAQGWTGNVVAGEAR